MGGVHEVGVPRYHHWRRNSTRPTHVWPIVVVPETQDNNLRWCRQGAFVREENVRRKRATRALPGAVVGQSRERVSRGEAVEARGIVGAPPLVDDQLHSK